MISYVKRAKKSILVVILGGIAVLATGIAFAAAYIVAIILAILSHFVHSLL